MFRKAISREFRIDYISFLQRKVRSTHYCCPLLFERILYPMRAATNQILEPSLTYYWFNSKRGYKDLNISPSSSDYNFWSKEPWALICDYK